ncbi:TetR family transcriptional regulator [Klebsiella pneumoniae subsp. ozaenae]|uniref:TetR family transcriptional regulator n=1 Tax=Klebsiella pneumoniae subsp. ozaenae TaxID=574 RepID=A0A377ZHP2_KLEPO|nr:TetR family transcriptional regulator [Klebsiella pneumoniae subsp. ozaenae]
MSVADLTQAFGINPPSFYAAFGSKLGLYTRVLQRYSQTRAIPIDALLRDGPAGGGVAHRRTAGGGSPLCGRSGRRRLPGAGGGYIVRMLMPGWRQANGMLRQEPKIQQYIARHRPQDALRVTDYMDTLMLGLSAKAREGDSLPRLLETVRLAGLALERILPA